MRWRGIPVLTNTPSKGPQRGPGENQMVTAIEPIIDKAAKQLGLDRVAIRRINAPDNTGKIWDVRQKRLDPLTSAFQKEALDKGAALFDWEEKKKTSGQRKGSKVIGVGVGQSYHGGGSSGFDGLVRITPDGKLHIHTGVGNLGTYSYAGNGPRGGGSSQLPVGQLCDRVRRHRAASARGTSASTAVLPLIPNPAPILWQPRTQKRNCWKLPP